MNRIEGALPARLVQWVLLEAGLDPEESTRFFDLQHPKRPTNGSVSGEFRFAPSEDVEEVCHVTISARSPSGKVVHVGVDAPSDDVAARLRSLFHQYEPSSDGESYRDFDAISAAQRADSRRADDALAAAGLEPLAKDRTHRRIDERTARALIDVFVSGGHHARLAVLFALQAPRTSKLVKRMLGDWLLSEFPKFENRRHRGQIGAALLDLVCPEHGDALVALIKDDRLRTSRAALCLPLAMSKAPRAAEILAGLLGGDLREAALHGLAKLGKVAAPQTAAVEPLVRDPDAEVRRLAKKVLVRLGATAPAARGPVHLVTNKAGGPPADSVEWSVNLDAADLEEALGVVGSAFEEGIGSPEIREVVAVADAMKVDEQRQFRFAVHIGGRSTEVWLGLLMGDEEAPDLYLFARSDDVSRVDAAWRRSRFGSE